jgi:hypothetical protein
VSAAAQRMSRRCPKIGICRSRFADMKPFCPFRSEGSASEIVAVPRGPALMPKRKQSTARQIGGRSTSGCGLGRTRFLTLHSSTAAQRIR